MAGNHFGRRSYMIIEVFRLIFMTKTVHTNAVHSPLHTTREGDGKIISVIETSLSSILRKF
jgi:hypothetical protein